MNWLIALVISLAATGYNVALYVAEGSYIALGCAVFTGGLSVFNLVKAVQAR